MCVLSKLEFDMFRVLCRDSNPRVFRFFWGFFKTGTWPAGFLNFEGFVDIRYFTNLWCMVWHNLSEKILSCNVLIISWRYFYIWGSGISNKQDYQFSRVFWRFFEIKPSQILWDSFILMMNLYTMVFRAI